MALILEDDIAFEDNCLEIGNQLLSRENLSRVIDFNKPYTVHLISVKHRRKKRSEQALKKTHVHYGNPAWITNYAMCQKLIDHLNPICMPCDDYLSWVKRKYGVQDYCVLPYLVREHSSHYYVPRNQRFVRLSEQHDIFEHMDRVCGGYFVGGGLFGNYLFSKMTKPGQTKFCGPNSSGLDITNSIVCGLGLNKHQEPVGQPIYITSLRGHLTKEVLQHRGISCPQLLGELALLTSKFYQSDVQTKETVALIRLIGGESLEQLVDRIHQSRIIASDQVLPLAIAQSYGIKNVWVKLPDSEINDFELHDYYSVFEGEISPIEIDNLDDLNLEEIKELTLTIDLDDLLLSLPFNHQPKRNLLKYM